MIGTEIEGYITSFVSQKSSIESFIDSSYEITIDVFEMNLEGMFIIIIFFYLHVRSFI